MDAAMRAQRYEIRAGALAALSLRRRNSRGSRRMRDELIEKFNVNPGRSHCRQRQEYEKWRMG